MAQQRYKSLFQNGWYVRMSTVRVNGPRSGTPRMRGLRTSGRPMMAIAAIALAAGLIAAAATGVDPSGLLHLAPALILVAALLARRYPGERLIARLAGSPIRARRHTRIRAVKPRTQHVGALAPRGGLLLARSLAVRPPPAVASAS